MHIVERYPDYKKPFLQNEVQIFATTHNIECLKFFKEALEEDDMKELQADVRSFTLQSLPGNQVKAYTYSYEQFEHAIEQGIEIRGNSDLWATKSYKFL